MTLAWAPEYENKPAVLPRMRASGFHYTSLTLSEDRFSLPETLHYLARQRAVFRDPSSEFTLATTVAEIRAARAARRHAIGFHFQGAAMLEGNPALVESFYALGIRHMLLAYNLRNSLADGCHERTDAGLSRKGLEFVQAMNRVGMMIDCTHMGHRSSLETIEASSAPVCFTHSNAAAIHPHPRNISDEQIRAAAQSDGIIGINGLGPFLGEDGRATVAGYLAHVLHLAECVGPSAVGLGLDYVYYPEQMYAVYYANPAMYPAGYPEPPWHFLEPEALADVTTGLVAAGMNDDEILGILGENYLRVAASVWM
jgi:membrane dipeptidase